MPEATPLTVPPVPTVATEVLLLVHEPPDVASVRLVVPPAHTAVVPVIDDGAALTVTVTETLQPVESW